MKYPMFCIICQVSQTNTYPRHVNLSVFKIAGYVLDGVPVLDSEFLSTEEQLSVIKNFDMTPEFIINIKISDADLVDRRSKQLLFPLANTLHSPDNIAPALTAEEEEGEEEGEEEDEDEEEGDDDDVDPDAIPEQVYSTQYYVLFLLEKWRKQYYYFIMYEKTQV